MHVFFRHDVPVVFCSVFRPKSGEFRSVDVDEIRVAVVDCLVLEVRDIFPDLVRLSWH